MERFNEKLITFVILSLLTVLAAFHYSVSRVAALYLMVVASLVMVLVIYLMLMVTELIQNWMSNRRYQMDIDGNNNYYNFV